MLLQYLQWHESFVMSLITYTKITETNLSAFAYRLFDEDFSSVTSAKFSQFSQRLIRGERR